MFRQTTFLIAIFGLLVISLGGCGKPNGLAEVNSTNLQRLSNLYARYQLQHQWQGPKDEAEFKAFINELGPTTLEPMGITGSVDDLFVSERDGQPFKIRYEVVGDSRGKSDPVVFESVGVDGKWMVGFTSMTQESVEDQTRYDGLFSGEVTSAPLISGTPPPK